MDLTLFNQSFNNGHLGSSDLFAITNIVRNNSLVHTFKKIIFFASLSSEVIPRYGIPDQRD